MGIDVVRAWPRRHEAVHLELPEGATVGDAVSASGFSTDGVTALAVFGERVEPGHRLRDGDRVELLRPLEIDPKDARRRRARPK
ncbi:RnfH family protein [Cognatiluteimonas profundi]|uniref:RnfH family protein n=1 Tax=Cognatiluteimonas profundi TaxID=2594501 RepID=UPI00131E1BC8|nr:RnfH family protein [Lysobacter profundi]